MSPEDQLRVARALADPQRFGILERITTEGELCCSQLVEQLGLSQATVSHHLKALSDAGLLARRRDGHYAYYSFRQDMLTAYITSLQHRLGG
jgi:DNA-binding transcriptional ArsR family regulator